MIGGPDRQPLTSMKNVRCGRPWSVDIDKTRLETKIESSIGSAPVQRERRTANVDRVRPSLERPPGASPMHDVGSNLALLDRQMSAALVDGHDAHPGVIRERDHAALREGHPRVFSRSRTNVAFPQHLGPFHPVRQGQWLPAKLDHSPRHDEHDGSGHGHEAPDRSVPTARSPMPLYPGSHARQSIVERSLVRRPRDLTRHRRDLPCGPAELQVGRHVFLRVVWRADACSSSPSNSSLTFSFAF